MSCLSTLVGVKGCGQSSTELYVQQLPGVTIASMDQAISNEHKAALPALTTFVEEATDQVLNEVRLKASAKYDFKSFIDNNVCGYYYEDKQEQAAEASYLTGYQIRLDQTPYLSFYINQLRLFVNHTGTVNVLVYDLIQGKLLDTIPVEAVAGEIVTVDVNKVYSSHKQRLNLFIGYASNFTSYNTSFAPVYSNTCADFCNICYSNSGTLYFRQSKIASVSPKLNTYVDTLSHGAGLSFNYSLQCSFDELLCGVRNMLAYAVLYKAGQRIMMEMKFSKRLTGIVTNFKADHAELMDYYEQEYNKQIKQVFDNMVLRDGLCYSCKQKVKSVVSLP